MMVEMNDAQAEAKRDHEEDSDNDISDRNSRVSPYFRNHKKFQQRTGEMQFFCDYLGSQLTSIKKASTRRRLERDILGMVHKALDSEEGILVFDNE